MVNKNIYAYLYKISLEIHVHVCYNVVTVKERLLCGGNTKGSEVMQPMTNEQSFRLEELIRENAKLRAKVKTIRREMIQKKNLYLNPSTNSGTSHMSKLTIETHTM